MSENMDFREFEGKWREKWKKSGIFKTVDFSDKPKCFVLDMFPYPSGSSMHIGHPRGYVATDVYSRFKRMKGFNVLHPMGWDAFGLPAEETAIEKQQHPIVTVAENIIKFRNQLEQLGMDYDWDREINTTDPAFYKQTQRIFLEFFKRNLAYNDMVTVNWCPALNTVLANEDILDGKSERGGHDVIQKPMRQWVLAITKYADRLISDLDALPKWPDSVKNAQRQWIGRSEGSEISFEVNDCQDVITVFSTRPETIFGATFIVLAPEYAGLETLFRNVKNRKEVEVYINESSKKTELARKTNIQKTGVMLNGISAINPITGDSIPVYVSDYVLNTYGTGAVMGVPAHDERDAEFAEKFNLQKINVINGDDTVINSGELSGLTCAAARSRIVELINAKIKVQYKIRDWVFSRQRFWGEPFPIVWIEGEEIYQKAKIGELQKWLPEQPVSYQDENGNTWFALPVLPEYLDQVALPNVKAYSTGNNGEGPLADISEWVNAFINIHTGAISNTVDDNTGSWFPVRRETSTMPQWAGSSWYYLRYIDPLNTQMPFDKTKADYWSPVDVYAGADHATAHLIYARFWHKVMFDAGMVRDAEPFVRLEFLGYILASDGTKISKRKGNGRSPDEVIEKMGADALRMYEMFIGPFEKTAPWNDNGLVGTKRFLDRVWRLGNKILSDAAAGDSDLEVEKSLHKTIKIVEEDIESFKFNTAVSQLMILLNKFEEAKVSKESFKIFLKILAPFAPFATEELWSRFEESESIHISGWPPFDSSIIQDMEVSISVQVNGKPYAVLNLGKDTSESEAKELARKIPKIIEKMAGKEEKRVIYVPSKIINFVV